eukprot:scaffold2044_cov305-Pavlova_lutheri.AAC.31
MQANVSGWDSPVRTARKVGPRWTASSTSAKMRFDGTFCGVHGCGMRKRGRYNHGFLSHENPLELHMSWKGKANKDRQLTETTA